MEGGKLVSQTLFGINHPQSGGCRIFYSVTPFAAKGSFETKSKFILSAKLIMSLFQDYTAKTSISNTRDITKIVYYARKLCKKNITEYAKNETSINFLLLLNLLLIYNSQLETFLLKFMMKFS